MERTTRKQLESMVQSLNKKLNRPATHSTKLPSGVFVPNERHLFLEYIAEYGGYSLAEVNGNGERHPIGAGRHQAGEMWHILKALTEVVCFGELQPIPKDTPAADKAGG